MIWKIELKPVAVKQYKKLDKKTRKRIKQALLKLQSSPNPLSYNNVKPLVGELKGHYRMRVGNWRILFTPDKNIRYLYVYAILPRGKAYK